MTAQNARLCYQNLLHDYPHNVWCPNLPTPEDPLENAYNWQPGTRWRPGPWLNDLASRGYNWDALAWDAGPTAPPTGWTLTGAGATVARSTDFSVRGPYSAELTRAGADAKLYLEPSIGHVLGKQYLLAGAWVKCDSPNGRMFRQTNFAQTQVAHTGGGGWEWLALVTYQGANISWFRVGIERITTDGTVLTDGLTVHWWINDQAATAPQATAGPAKAYIWLFGNNAPMRNGAFRNWSQGPNSVPDDWTFSGTGTISSINNYFSNAVEMNSQAAGPQWCSQDFNQSLLTESRGKSIRFGARAFANVNNSVRIEARITHRDGTVTSSELSAYHAAAGTIVWLTTASLFVPPDAEGVAFYFHNELNTTIARLSGVTYTLDGSAPASTPHAIPAFDYIAVADHNLIGMKVQTNANHYWSGATTDRITATPTPGKTHIQVAGAPLSGYTSIRIELDGGTNAPEVGVLSVGLSSQLPEVIVDWDHYGRDIEVERMVSDRAYPVQSMHKVSPVPKQLVMEWVEESFYSGALSTFLAHAGDRGGASGQKHLPFFLLPEGGDHPNDAWLAWLRPGAITSPWDFGRRVQRAELPIYVMPEP